jgi:hypothetical protein
VIVLLQAGVLSVMKLSDMETSELEALFARWPSSGITFPAFVALLRAQFGRAIGIEWVAPSLPLGRAHHSTCRLGFKLGTVNMTRFVLLLEQVPLPR